ncbi:hypothetical protein D3C80_1311680 [compost metagenome]
MGSIIHFWLLPAVSLAAAGEIDACLFIFLIGLNSLENLSDFLKLSDTAPLKVFNGYATDKTSDKAEVHKATKPYFNSSKAFFVPIFAVI